jgi:transposase-like protein
VKFKVFFDNPLTCEDVWSILAPQVGDTVDPWVLSLDGTWLRRRGVVLIYRDVTHHENLFWAYAPSESYAVFQTSMEYFTRLLGKNAPTGVVSDWKGALVSAVSLYFPGVPHQRCLVHVVREAKRLLAKGSPFPFTLHLRDIAKQLIKINTLAEKRVWLSELIAWEKTYGHHLKERTFNPETDKRWWYTHGNLRRAWRLLTDDWQPFFVYLDHHLIPKSNNSIEGVNGQLKNKLQNHRGMKTPQQVSFLFWYLTFTRAKTKQDLKKLWDYWKKGQ